MFSDLRDLYEHETDLATGTKQKVSADLKSGGQKDRQLIEERANRTEDVATRTTSSAEYLTVRSSALGGRYRRVDSAGRCRRGHCFWFVQIHQSEPEPRLFRTRIDRLCPSGYENRKTHHPARRQMRPSRRW